MICHTEGVLMRDKDSTITPLPPVRARSSTTRRVEPQGTSRGGGEFPEQHRGEQPAMPTLPLRESKNNATEEVIAHVNAMIENKTLAPGDRLPAEISFARQLGVPRSAVSKAYSKLEAYGLIRTIPQSGTYLAGIESDALTALLHNVMSTQFITVEPDDIELLYMVRAFLEEAAAVPLAKTATDAELRELAETAAWVKTKILEQNGTIEDDLLFHLKIAELSKRPFFKSILLFIAAPMVNVFRHLEKNKRTDEINERWKVSMGEHDEILSAILARDEDRIREAIRAHCRSSVAFRSGMLRRNRKAK